MEVMNGNESHGGCSGVPKTGCAVSTGGQQRVPGPVSEQEPEHHMGGQGWEMCESVCYAAVLSCFSKEQTVPNAVFCVCCSWCPASQQAGDGESVCWGEWRRENRGRLGRGVRR